MILTGVVALYCGLFFALPPGLSAFFLIFGTGLVMPSALVTGIVYGCGYLRAFFIGCTASCGWAGVGAVYFGAIMLVSGGQFVELFDASNADVIGLKWSFVILHATTLVSGFLAIGIRWLCLRGASSTNITTIAQPLPATVLIDPRDKAELYAILQGRLTSGAAMSNGDGANAVNSLSETSTLNCTTTSATDRWRAEQ